MRSTIPLLALGLTVACAGADDAPDAASAAPTFELLLATDVQWDQLNPARGDASPRAGTLWGDRGAAVPTAFLFNPVDGFESPPHIHNVTYRGVVIRGLVHNDDPAAEPMWMPAQSFWTQPKGQVHITSATGTDTLAYIEIDHGPYLVMPPEERFDAGEQPVNVHESNLVWVDLASDEAPDGVQVATLWSDRGDSRVSGTMLRLPAGEPAVLVGHGPELRAVVIQGEPRYSTEEDAQAVALPLGSYFGSTGAASHRVHPDDAQDTILYVLTADWIDVR